MKIFLKFLISLLSLPFLIPWFLADKTFEYIFQPFIFKKYSLELPRKKVWAVRLVKILPVVFFVFYIIKKIFIFFKENLSFITALQNVKILFYRIYNDFVRSVNFLLTPINETISYLSGRPIIKFWEFVLYFYICLVLVIFIINLVYRLIRTLLSINKAVSLRNKAIRDVDIVRFSESAKEDEIFLGLDLNRGNQPYYAKRSWLKGHIQVIGGPGSGKTESIIQPIWFQEVRRNVATFVLDGKASRRNIDRFYTIATSLAQGQEIHYFNPVDPERSATYNPLLRGTAGEVKQKIMSSINWAEYPPESRERLDSALNIFLRAMEDTNTYFNLRELLEYFQSRGYVGKQSERVSDHYVRNSLRDILMDFHSFQANTSFFIGLLRDLFQSGYAKLLNTERPEIDIIDIYQGHKDCYFTLPMHTNENTSRFLGQLILQDIQYCFRHIAMQTDNDGAKEGLLIVDEMAKFVSPHFIEILEASRNVGVSVCYTNQSLAELDNPTLNLSKLFIDQLADHTNAICCFQLGSPESIQMMLDRIGKADSDMAINKNDIKITNPDLIKHLEVGHCIVFIHRPQFSTMLKTGYFKFDKLLTFSGQGEGFAED